MKELAVNFHKKNKFFEIGPIVIEISFLKDDNKSENFSETYWFGQDFALEWGHTILPFGFLKSRCQKKVMELITYLAKQLELAITHQ